MLRSRFWSALYFAARMFGGRTFSDAVRIDVVFSNTSRLGIVLATTNRVGIRLTGEE